MPVPPLGLLAGIGGVTQAAGSLFGLGLGISQLVKARGIRTVRPQYDIPEEYAQRQGLRQALLNSNPEAYVTATQNLQESQSAAINSARNAAPNSSALLATASSAQANTNRGLRQLAIQQQGDYNQRLAGLESAQMAMASQEEKAFELNKMEPYRDAVAQKSALTEGGINNISGALGGISSMAGSAYDMEAENGAISSLFRMFASKSAPVFDPSTSARMGAFMGSNPGINTSNPLIPQLQNTQQLPYGNALMSIFNSFN